MCVSKNCPPPLQPFLPGFFSIENNQIDEFQEKSFAPFLAGKYRKSPGRARFVFRIALCSLHRTNSGPVQRYAMVAEKKAGPGVCKEVSAAAVKEHARVGLAFHVLGSRLGGGHSAERDPGGDIDNGANSRHRSFGPYS